MKKLLDVLWRAPIFLLVWVGVILIKFPTMILGLIMVPLLYLYRKRPFDEVPKLFFPWQNPEDWNGGIAGTEHSLPQWWINQRGYGFWSWFIYHAVRNPANGLRNFDFIDLDLDQTKIYYWTPHYLKYYEPWFTEKNDGPKTYGYVAWQGWMAGVKFVHVWNSERHFVLKFGWRVEPRDAIEGYRASSHRWSGGAGFATKFLPYRES